LLEVQAEPAAASAKPRMTLRVIADFFWLRHAGFASFTSLRDMSLRRNKSEPACGRLGKAEDDPAGH
jgi:hypothetical protein